MIDLLDRILNSEVTLSKLRKQLDEEKDGNIEESS